MVLGGSGLRALVVLGGAGVWGPHPVGRDMLVQLEAGVPWVRGQCRRAAGSSVPLIFLFLDPRLRPQLQGIDPRVRGPPALDGEDVQQRLGGYSGWGRSASPRQQERGLRARSPGAVDAQMPCFLLPYSLSWTSSPRCSSHLMPPRP